jgi:hypothetical protein
MNNRETLIHVKYYKVICLCIIFSQQHHHIVFLYTPVVTCPHAPCFVLSCPHPRLWLARGIRHFSIQMPVQIIIFE